MKLLPSDIVLILPPRRWKERRYSLGLLFISGYLRSNGYDNIILERKLLAGREYDNSLARELLLKKIEELKPKIIAFTGTILETNEIIELNNKIKEKIEVFSIVGGPQASVCPEEFVKNNFDAAAIGEGEETILELVRAIENNDSDLGKIKGIAYKDKEGNIRVNPRRELMDISFLPLPAYDKIDMAYHTAITNEVVRGIPVKPAMVMSSRGCPFLCSFCSTYKVFGRKVRYRNPESVKKEIEFLKNNYGVESIWFSDDTMTINKEHLLKICRIMKNLELFWTAQARVDLVDEDVVKEMKESGCLQLEFGIESGCPRLLNEIIIKQINLEQVKKAVALCRKYKIRVLANFMMGFPTETKKEMEATFNLAKSLKANIYSFSILTPLPGTDIFNRFFKDEIIMNDYKDLSFFIGKKKFNKSEVDDLKKLNDIWRKKLWLQVRIRNLTHPFLFIKIFFKLSHKKERIKFVFNKIKKLIKFNKHKSMGSEKRFGYEWGKYHQMDSNYEIQFKKWISPFSQEIFKDKKVLDAG
ncbi:MAG: radical SAM protein [Parcubacteria group bacterium Athens0714_12]|nr:MAG: radical SAM protein [Parcubacteria group bacterium Athens0714_12]